MFTFLAQNDFLAGVLILKVVKQHEFASIFSRVTLFDGEAMTKILNFTGYLNRKADIYGEFNCEAFLRYYLLCIHPDYRSKGLGFQLLHTAFDVARSLKIPVVMGLFGNYRLQKVAKRLGMKVTIKN